MISALSSKTFVPASDRNARAQRRKDFRLKGLDRNDSLEFTKQLATLEAQWLKK
jgi:hypothetical protein